MIASNKPSYRQPSACLFFSSSVKAGFPSPAEDYLETKLDLNEYLVKHPAATFFVKVSGDSMIGAGICDGDTLVVDRSLVPRNHDVVLAVLNGEFTVKRLNRRQGRVTLCPENSEYTPIEITSDMDFEIWGVVSHAIHFCRA